MDAQRKLSMQADIERECVAYCEHLNSLLSDYEQALSEYLPLRPESFFLSLRDGVVLAHLLHYFYPESIAINQITRGIDLDKLGEKGNERALFEATANLNRVLDVARQAKGLVVVNVGAQDILDCRADLVLGLLWQLIRGQLLGEVNLICHPELVRLLEDGESLASLVAIRPEPLLIRWFNYHLERSAATGSILKVNGFSKDICDGEAYLRLISAIAMIDGEAISVEESLKLPAEERVNEVIALAEKIGCTQIIKAADILSGHPRLNLAFTATLFNQHVGIHLPTEEELRRLYEEISGLRRTVGSLEGKLSDVEHDSQKSKQILEAENDGLRAKLEALQLAHQTKISQLAAEFETRKEEIAQEYRESFEEARNNERRICQEEVGRVRGSLREHQRQLMQQICNLANMIGEDILDGTKAGEAFKRVHESEVSLEVLLSAQSQMITLLAETNKRNTVKLGRLQEELAHKATLEETMKEKIRQYSMERISALERQKEEDEASRVREPALVRFRKAITCQLR